MRGIEFATVEDQRQVHVVKAHRTVVRSADATEQQVIVLVLGRGHILEALGRFADCSEPAR